MEEIIYLTEIYDLYNNMLTDKQKKVFEDYYFENLTLEEIAENLGVSKNAVSKSIKNVKSLLLNYEENIKFNSYMKNVKKEFENEKEILMRISKYDNIVL